MAGCANVSERSGYATAGAEQYSCTDQFVHCTTPRHQPERLYISIEAKGCKHSVTMFID